ncbi:MULTISPECIES: PTS sugar transporter subunit IIA [unclassified Breznakia]|uniref:PTS sugar transporter subunit IIA n=1 Tax=unclassified Breznakia TaxID=2623764 RepID=UPI002475527D|nr:MULTISPECIES: PTS sugar transporter subunit IIA [unclassified Breznakia]MDH6367486.1 PTS system ascorbate-specific IIA component [Breznakia sp. PH1-1]MDH6404606.1 PTS system ascorbate-specific IIA component [Breznakia sp. PF1-11]MDH6412315.1 PTS system ascorbate-specific IIA component [Breznakia sp. PFB1-11]MDH6414653.1 PTS system ascorbate-specific IIA component [Breznakia sp. PFB1-14]MDH6416952.1 PTS system ascorbate-specific IIA component [Breznakia sp. PFB1-4]
MNEIIRMNHILINQKANTWEEAIRLTGHPLVKSHAIDMEYVDNMVTSVKELGPYIVIMPHFALAHAAPGIGVHQSEMSIATFPEGVCFDCDNDPVKVLICMACIDKTSHIDRLQKIANILMDETIIQRMCDCTSKQELYDIINTDGK